MASWKNPVHRVLNLVLYLLGCFVIGSGLLLWLRLPRGPHGPRGGRGGGSGGATVLGLTRHGWGDWHLYAALGLVVLVGVHLWLNRVWLVKVAGGRHAWRLWLGLAVGAALVAGFMLVPVAGGRG